MFESNTVFVMGAGASCHYGYPTGEELVHQVIQCTKTFRTYCANRKGAGFNQNQFPRFMNPTGAELDIIKAQQLWDKQIEQCDDLVARLQAIEPVVIDYFLGWNEPLHELGRTMIAAALLQCEANGAGRAMTSAESSQVYGYAGRNNWIRFIVHQLLMDCEKPEHVLLNPVCFITFNYERSFETNLHRALSAVGYLNGGLVSRFMSGRTVHMYGELSHQSAPNPGDYQSLTHNFVSAGLGSLEQATRLVNTWHTAAEDLRVIDPHTKNDSPASAAAKLALQRADRVYFLGYSFDPENNRRLGLDRTYDPRGKTYYFTNFRNSGTVNQHAARALDLPGIKDSDAPFVANGNVRAFRSARNCYEAIALDFGMLSE